MRGEGAVHHDELLADCGVDGDLLPEHLHLLVRHHLDAVAEPGLADAPGEKLRAKNPSFKATKDKLCCITHKKS